MLAEEPQRQQNQIVEVHGIAGVQGGFVTLSDVFGQRADAWIAKDAVAAFAAVFELAQHCQHRAGIGLFAFGGNGGKNFFYRRKLLGFVVNDEILFVAKFVNVHPQYADAERMKRADGRAVRLILGGIRAPARQQFVHAFLHFARGLVCECHAENVTRCDAALDHVRDAKGDDARLACARAGEDQHWTTNGLGGLALLRVERGQIQHRARSLNCRQGNASLRLISRKIRWHFGGDGLMIEP